MNFSYKAPPIVARFMRDDNHIRVIQGPQGCLSADTEFLTPHGWKCMDAFTPGDEVAQWNASSRHMRFTAPREYHVLPCDEFIHFSTQHTLSMVLSDEHRVPCYDWKNKFAVKSAAQLAKRPSKTTIPTTFTPVTPGIGLSDAEIQLAVAQHADGHIDSSGATIITARKERKKTRLRALLATLGISAKEHAHATRPTETAFRFRWHHRDKTFASWWYLATEAQLTVVMDEVTHWDGMFEGEETVYYSRHKPDADFVQYAAHATGGRGSISQRTHTNPKWQDNYAVHIARAGSTKAKVMLRGDTTKINRVPSADGFKYCFTTTEGFFLARHAGKIFVTGNSGKSSGSCVELLRRCVQRRPDSDGKRRARFVVVRNTIPMLRDTTIPTFLRWFPHGTLGTWHSTNKEYHFRFGDVDSQILFRALDDADDIGKLLSSEYTGCYFNEFREIDPAIFEAMTKRVGRWVTDPNWTKTDIDAAWWGIWADTNPPQYDSWLYQMQERVIPNDWSVYKQPSGRSPEAENVDHLRSDYYDATGLSEEYIRVMIDGEYGFDQSGLPVFGKTYIPSWHVSSERLRMQPGAVYPLLLGADAGLTPAAIIGQVDYRGRLLILGECFVEASESMGMERFCNTRLLPYMMQHFPLAGKAFVTADPAIMHRGQANEMTPWDILIKYFNVSLAFTDKLPARLNAAETYFSGQVDGKPRIILDGAMTPKLQATLAHNYKFAKKKNTGGINDEIKDMPEKNHPWSDIADAFMYLCMHAGSNYAASMSQPARKIEVVSARGWT